MDAPSKQRVEEVVSNLQNSTKVITVTDCPEHFSRSYCGCPVGMALLKPHDISHCKVNIFQRYLDVQLLAGCEHAFDYVAEWDQSSQRTFTDQVGKSPKQFARSFLKMTGVMEMFAPSVTLSDTLDAIMDYWAVRNVQWMVKYGTREKAYEKWFKEAYDMSDLKKIEGVGQLIKEGKLKLGDPIMTHELQYGPPGHRCMVLIMPLGNDTPAKVMDAKRCHENCPVMGPQQEQEVVEYFSRELASRK